VPCGTCTACCTSSQFIHIGPEETDALAHIPADLLFPAPRSPRGHVLLGYDERGHCPMLVDEKCSIYAHRPKTCRTYDCRVFSAADVELHGGQHVKIERQVRRWRFSYSNPVGQRQHEAVKAAASYLKEHAGLLPGVTATTTSARLAVLAFEIHGLFLMVDEKTPERSVAPPELGAVLTRLTALDATKEP
jgi:Fe-S-cluster containining protein